MGNGIGVIVHCKGWTCWSYFSSFTLLEPYSSFYVNNLSVFPPYPQISLRQISLIITLSFLDWHAELRRGNSACQPQPRADDVLK